MLHEELVTFRNVTLEIPRNHLVQRHRYRSGEPSLKVAVRPKTSLIVNKLSRILVFPEHGNKVHDAGVLS